MVNEKQEIILQAIIDRDEELLKSVLSEAALKTDDLNEGIGFIFEIFEGNVVNIEKKDALFKVISIPENGRR